MATTVNFSAAYPHYKLTIYKNNVFVIMRSKQFMGVTDDPAAFIASRTVSVPSVQELTNTQLLLTASNGKVVNLIAI